jgi:type IV secretory pathway VirB3-like protein
MWFIIYGMVTEGRDFTKRFKWVFGVASLPLALIVTFAGLAFIAGNHTSEALVQPTLHFLHLC